MGKEDDEPEVLDMDQVAELELSRLTRQYRIMEGDRFTYSGEAGGKIKRLRKQIKILRSEQNNVLSDLTVATSLAKQREDSKVNTNLDKLLEQYECLGKSVKVERSQTAELDFQIKKMERAVTEIKTRTVTDLQCQQRILAGQRTVAMLENKLDVYMKRFNITVGQNYKLRMEIDHLLKERAHFNLLWERLIHSLNEGKKFMLDLIEQATIAYDQREECCSKLAYLRTRGSQDLLLHTKEIRFLQRKLDHDAKLQEFLGIKGQRRILADLEAREIKKKQQVKENMEKQLVQYNETLQQIKEFCGESDVGRLAAKFVKQEEENFALFNYVNELNHESENLSYAIDELKKNIDMQRELNNTRVTQQKDNIASMAAQLKIEQNKANAAEKKLKQFDTDLDTVFKGIDKVFKLLQCDNDPILDLLGENEEINAFNVLMYLGLIENRTTELMQQVYYKEKIAASQAKRGRAQPPTYIKADAKTRYHQNPLNVLVPSQPCPLCVETEQVSDVIDTLQFAQGPDEVVEKLGDRLKLPHALDRLHNVSNCHLPQSRKIIQQRYQ